MKNIGFETLCSILAKELLYNYVIEQKGVLSESDENVLNCLIETLEFIRDDSKLRTESKEFKEIEQWIIKVKANK